MSIFEKIQSQYIDSNGKSRILNYTNGVSLYVMPLPPFGVQQVEASETNLTTVALALKFIKDKGLEIVEQDGFEQENTIRGLWVKSLKGELVHGYIPIKLTKSNAIKNVPFNDGITPDPIFVDIPSTLDIMRMNSKIAEYLKQYSLIEWAQDPDNFGTGNYIVKKNHNYNIESIFKPCEIVRNNKHFYSNDRIIVPDKDTEQRLIMFVKATIMNSANLQQEYLNKTVFDGRLFYTSLKDFRSEGKQVLFMNTESLIRWKMEKSRGFMNGSVHSLPRSDVVEPYYYRNLNILHGRLLLLQNTNKGDYISALTVSKYWERKKTNIGYTPEDVDVEQVIDDYPNIRLCFNVYTEEGLTHTTGNATDIDPRMYIFAYENGQYAAILPLG